MQAESVALRRRTDLPDAWPGLLTLREASVYCGMSPSTFQTTCPVPPLELERRMLRWSRAALDSWIAGLPARGLKSGEAASGLSEPKRAGPSDTDFGAARRRAVALERARSRPCGPSRTSSV